MLISGNTVFRASPKELGYLDATNKVVNILSSAV